MCYLSNPQRLPQSLALSETSQQRVGRGSVPGASRNGTFIQISSPRITDESGQSRDSLGGPSGKGSSEPVIVHPQFQARRVFASTRGSFNQLQPAAAAMILAFPRTGMSRLARRRRFSALRSGTLSLSRVLGHNYSVRNALGEVQVRSCAPSESDLRGRVFSYHCRKLSNRFISYANRNEKTLDRRLGSD